MPERSILIAGTKPSSPHHSFITESYELLLNEDPTSMLDPKHLASPRQRVEFRSPVNAAGKRVRCALYIWDTNPFPDRVSY